MCLNKLSLVCNKLRLVCNKLSLVYSKLVFSVLSQSICQRNICLFLINQDCKEGLIKILHLFTYKFFNFLNWSTRVKVIK